MTRERINTLAAALCAGLALSAAALVAVVLATGWERNLPDEGTAAHLWQILVGASLATFAVFLASSDWKRRSRSLALLGLQGAALAVAIGPVAALGL